MTVLLDSDTLSELSRGHPCVTAHAKRYLAQHGRLTVSVITIFERLRGYHAAIAMGRPYEPQLNHFRTLAASSVVLAVDFGVSEVAAEIWAALPAKRRSAIGDILIAATAVANKLTLATRNQRDFAAMQDTVDLRLVDWIR